MTFSRGHYSLERTSVLLHGLLEGHLPGHVESGRVSSKISDDNNAPSHNLEMKSDQQHHRYILPEAHGKFRIVPSEVPSRVAKDPSHE